MCSSVRALVNIEIEPETRFSSLKTSVTLEQKDFSFSVGSRSYLVDRETQMFRNFVKPAALDRGVVCERNGTCEQTVDHVLQAPVNKDVAVSTYGPDTFAGTKRGQSVPRDVTTFQSNCKAKANHNTKTVYKTSIYVNGSILRSNSSTNVPLSSHLLLKNSTNVQGSQRQSFQPQDHLPRVLDKPTSFPSSKALLTSYSGPEVLKRSCTLPVSDLSAVTNCQHNEATTKVQLSRQPLTDEPTTKVQFSRQPPTDEPTTKAQLSRQPLIDDPTTKVQLSRQPLTDVPPTKVQLSRQPLTDDPTTNVQLSRQPLTDVHKKPLDLDSKVSVRPYFSADSRADGAYHTTNESEECAPEMVLARRGLYTQERYHIVPSPPPLVESVFVGRRDVRDPASVHERQIISVKGTVRGFKNRVRAGVATFWAQSEETVFQHTSADQQPRTARNYRQMEHGRIVVYATSMTVVRETDERCKSVRRLLQNHMVRYEERDMYMSRETQLELSQRLASEGFFTIQLPHVFADGIHLGGAGELEKLNEAGELRGLLDSYQKVIVRFMCDKCGGYRFVPCEFCHGSKKSLIRNHFTEEFCALRCMHCDENGLRRCDLCVDQQE